jgi:hypothetical protein
MARRIGIGTLVTLAAAVWGWRFAEWLEERSA